MLQIKVILHFSSQILLSFFLLHYCTKVQWWIKLAKVNIIALAPVLGTKWFIFKLIKYDSCRFFINVPYQLRIFSSIPVYWEFVSSGDIEFHQIFFFIHWEDKDFFYGLLTWFINLFVLLNQPFSPEIKPIWLWFIIFFTYWWIQC